ncbi:MAG TPA: hypothetical protein VF139_09030 [Candidatus Polarisedimenticolaceae bacterium]
MRGGHGRPGTQGAQEVEPLRGGEQLDREHRLDIVHDARGLPGRGHPHRHVVLLGGGGGDRVDGRRVGEDLVLGDQGGGGDVGHHESRVQAWLVGEERREVGQVGIEQALDPPLRDRRERTRRDGEVVEGESHRLPVEVPPGNEIAVLREDHRVVRRCVDLDGEDAAHVRQGVPDRPVHLGHAAQRIGVLDLAAVGVRTLDRAPLEQAAQVRRGAPLAGVGPRVVQPRVERPVGSLEGLEGHRARDVGDRGEPFGAQEGEHADRGHHLGAVDQRETFLRHERRRADPRAAHRLRGGHAPSPVERLAFADEGQRDVGEGSQVPRGPHRAPLGDERDDAASEHLHQRLEGLEPDPGVPSRETVGAQGEDRANDRDRQRIPHPRRVRAEEIQLQLGEAVVGDRDLREMAEAGVDAVDPRPAPGRLLHGPTRGGHPSRRRRGERRPGAAGDGFHAFQGEGATVEKRRSGEAGLAFRGPSDHAAAMLARAILRRLFALSRRRDPSCSSVARNAGRSSG